MQKLKIKILLLTVCLLLITTSTTSVTYAALELYFSEDTEFTVNGLIVTVKAGSNVDQITLSDISLEVVISPGGSIIIESLDRRKFIISTPSSVSDSECVAGYSSVTLSASGTVSPSSIETCTTGGGGGVIIIPPPLPPPLPPPVDVCPNISGVQEIVPSGYQIVDGQCVLIPIDVCLNIGGLQTVVPSGYQIVDGQCVVIPLPPPLPPPPPPPPPPLPPPLPPPPSLPPLPNGGGTSGGSSGGSGYIPILAPIQPAVLKMEKEMNETQKKITEAQEVVKIVSKTVVANTEKVVVQTKEAINTDVGKTVTQAAVGVTTAVTVTEGIAVSFFPFMKTFGDLFLIISRAIVLLLESAGLRKKIRKWGIVYDSKTKRPLDPVYVVMYNEKGEEVGQKITDMQGRFGFLVPPGKYFMKANKTHYSFPSNYVQGLSDELYENIYHGEILNIENPEVINVNVPMDPVDIDWNEEIKKKIMGFNPRKEIWKKKLSTGTFWGGFGISGLVYWATPTTVNLIVVCVYVGLLVLRNMGFKLKAYGRITDKETGKPISFAKIKIFPESLSDTQIGTSVSDIFGRYYLLVVGEGKYLLKIAGKNIDGKEINAMVNVTAGKERIINSNIVI